MIEHKLYMNNQLSIVTCMLRSESKFFFHMLLCLKNIYKNNPEQ